MYRAEIALARYDAPEAERIMEELGRQYGENSAFLFEAAQYCARKCDYDRAIEYYELAFQKDPARPRFQDALMGMAEIWEIRGDYRRAAETYGQIVELLETEWGLTEDLSLQVARDERARLLARA